MKPYSQFIFSNILVTLVFSACIEQKLNSQFYSISVNVPYNNLSVKVYTICIDLKEEIFRKVGNFTCSNINGCSSTNVAPFQQKPVIDILNNLFMDNKNVTYLKYICRREVKSTDGVISDFNNSVLIDNGYFFNSTTRFLAAWDTSDFQNLPRRKATLYRGNVKRIRLDNHTEYITFRYKADKYFLRLNEEINTNNYINIQLWYKEKPVFHSKYLPYIKSTNIDLPFCNRYCNCKGFSDFIKFNQNSDESQLYLYISLSFNGLTVITIVYFLVVKLFMLSRKHCTAKKSYSKKNQQENETDKGQNDTYVEFVGRQSNKKDQPNQSSIPFIRELNTLKHKNLKETPPESHEYFTIGSEIPTQYQILK